MMDGNLPAVKQSVTRYRFSATDRVQIDGADHVARSSDRLGYVLAKVDDADLSVSYTHAQIRHLHQAGRLKVFQGWYDSRKALLRNHAGTVLLTDLPEAEQKLIHWRVEFCDRFLRLEVNDRSVRRSDESMRKTIKQVLVEIIAFDTAQQGKRARCGKKVEHRDPPSPRTLRKWLHRYELGGFEPISLRPGTYRCGNRVPRMDGDSYQLVIEYAWKFASSNKPSKKMVFEEYKEAAADANAVRAAEGRPPLQVIKLRAFEKQISRLPPFAVCAGREGYETALRKFALVHRGLDVTRALERVEMDEFKVSLQTIMVEAGIWERLSPEQKALVARTRAWLSLVIDCATKYVLAIRLLAAEPSAASALAATEMAIFDKSELAAAASCLTQWEGHGLFETLSTDGGSAFIATETRSALVDLQIAYENPPAGLPYLRGTVERMFLTIRTRLLAMFPGQTFEHVVARGRYDAEGNACLDLEELNRVLIRWVVDIYHDSPHEGLAGETPRQAWLRLNQLYGVTAPPDHLRTHVFGIKASRQIGNRGIVFLGLNYQSRELQDLRVRAGNKKVDIRVNRFDLGAISVRVGRDWITVPCAFEEVAGVSVQEWVATAEDLRRRNANTAAMAEETVRQTLAHTRSLADMAIKRAEIGQPVISPEQIEKAEHDLFRAFSFAGQTDVDDEDLLGGDDAMPPAASLPPPAPSVPDEFGDPDDWL